MSEPLFRKGDVLVWNPVHMDATREGGYLAIWGMGPFIAIRDMWRDDMYYPVESHKGGLCHAWRLQRDEFLTAAAKAVASEGEDHA